MAVYDRWPAVDGAGGQLFYSAAADEGKRHRRGGMVGEVEGYVRMRRQRLGVAGEGRGGRRRQAAGGEQWGNGVWCVL